MLGSLGREFIVDDQVTFETIAWHTRQILKVPSIPFEIELFDLSDEPFDLSRFKRRVKLQSAAMLAAHSRACRRTEAAVGITREPRERFSGCFGGREGSAGEASSLSDLSRPAAEIGDSARIPLRFRHLCSHKLLKLMKILTRTPIPSLSRSKSDRLLDWDYIDSWCDALGLKLGLVRLKAEAGFEA